jgi:DNA-binding beta-propeller fold protein YncE/cytochrome c553
LTHSIRPDWRRVASGLLVLLGVVSTLLNVADRTAAGEKSPGDTRLRYPVALAFADHGNLVLTANERSGTVSLIDMTTRRIVAEQAIGSRLSDLVAVPGSDELFLTTDAAGNKLRLLVRRGTELKVVDSLGVAAFPVSVRIDQAGKKCFVASLWSRSLTVVDLVPDAAGNVRLKVAKVVPLPFAPRLQALSPDGGLLVVAGAFGGELAALQVPDMQVAAVKSLPAQNIRGLAWSNDGRRLYVAHQFVNRLGYTSPEDLHWGSVVTNLLRSLARPALEDVKTDIHAGSQSIQLGEVGNGAGDPAGLAVMGDGNVAIALGGIGEVAKGRLDSGTFRRLTVGVRPTTLMVNSVDDLIVADTFGDSIAIVRGSNFESKNGAKEVVRISLGPQPLLSGADRGERLFFDAHLGLENWMSCHSCHSDGHSSDALSDTLGDGTFGAAKRIPPLGGVADTAPFAWNGSMPDLSKQVRKSLKTTLRTKSVTEAQVSDLTAYLKTLKPAPPVGASPDAGEQLATERGHAIFTRYKCDRCHIPPTFTSPRVYDVGLRDDLGNRQFNPPSLRGVSQRSAFFHDGRARSLRDVFAVHKHPGNTQLPESDLADLLAFLRSV